MAVEDDPESAVATTDEQQYVHELDDGQLPSEAVYTTVAAATDTEPLALSPLADAIDTDALDRMHGPGAAAADARTTFSYEGLRVAVDTETVALQGDLDSSR